MSNFRAVCEEAAREAGKILLAMQSTIQGREKGPNDLVSEADLAAQRAIRAILLRDFPDFGFLGEEDDPATRLSPANLPEFCWVVDPLDGTTNYLHRMPAFAVSIALLKRGQVHCGTVFDPVLKEFFWAERGGGAWLNGERIGVSRCQQASQALVAASLAPHVPRGSKEVERFTEAIYRCQGVRRLGSAALNLSYVACGRLDAYWATSVKIWDVAAGLLLIEEAGGTVTDIHGDPIRLEKPELLVASSVELNRELVEMLS